MSGEIVRLGVDLALVAALVAIAAIDAREHRIPDRLSLPLLVAGLAWTALDDPGAWAAHAAGALAGFASLAAFGALHVRWRGREGLGLGDAKLFGAAGAWLGWQALPGVLLVASISALAFALLAGAPHGDRRIAFGPWLALGVLASLLHGRI